MNYKNIEIKETKIFDLQRKVVSHITSTSWKHIPHVSYLYEPDITDFYNEFLILSKERTKMASSKQKISFNTIMIKVIVEGLLTSPELNSYIEYNHKRGKGILHVCKDINVSVPWLLSNGKMITPIIPNVDKMSLNQISEYIINLAKRIEKTDINEMLYQTIYSDTIDEIKKFNFKIISRILSAKIGKHRTSKLTGNKKKFYYNIPEGDRLTEKDIMNGTFTISNIGSLYKGQKGFFGILEIIPPQILAIGISSIQEKPGIYSDKLGNKQIGIRKFLPLCIAFDHRAVDFNSLVPFLKKLDNIFATPKVIHSW